MPKLTTVNLGSNPLEEIAHGTFRSVPIDQELNILIGVWLIVNHFSIRELTKLKKLVLHCRQMFTPEIQEKMFKDSNIQLINARIEMWTDLGRAFVHQNETVIDDTQRLKQTKVNMSKTNVSLHIHERLQSTDDCLSIEGVVIASQLSVRCSSVNSVDITTKIFKKLAENVTILQLDIEGVTLGKIAPLKKTLTSCQSQHASSMHLGFTISPRR